MTTSTELFYDAELAMAAYAELHVGITNTQISALTSVTVGMTQSQAEVFAARYTEVVAVSPDFASGFSATVFRDADGYLVFAIRGTAGITDLVEDFTTIWPYGAAYGQIVDMYNWWQQISKPAGQSVEQFSIEPAISDGSFPDNWVMQLPTGQFLVRRESVATGVGPDGTPLLALGNGSTIDITGHSLGGHLAMAFASLFSSSSGWMSAFNAPGFIDNVFNREFFAALHGVVPGGIPGAVNVVAVEDNSYADSSTPISGLWSRPGQPVNIAIEDQQVIGEPDAPISGNHSIQVLTDSLAVYQLLAQLDPGIDTTAYRTVFDSAANRMYQSLERMVDAVQSLVGVGPNLLSTGNDQRDDLYEAIYALQGNTNFQNLAGHVTFYPGTTPSVAAARADFASFVTVMTLSPLAIGADAVGNSQLRQIHSTLAAQWDQGSDGVSDLLLADRVRMLATLVDMNRSDSQHGDLGTPSKFSDLASGIVFDGDGFGYGGSGDGSIADPLRARYVFGSDANEDATAIVSSANGDHLYGMGGDDTIVADGGRDWTEGNAGADRLEGQEHDDTLLGGAGNDVLIGGTGNDWLAGGEDDDRYEFLSGDGFDVIVDDAGSDTITIDGAPLTGGVETAPGSGVWKSPDGQLIYIGVTNPDTDWALSIVHGTDVIRLVEYVSGQFGITLQDAPAPGPDPTADFSLAGDLEPLDTDPTEPGIQYAYDAYGNVLTTASVQMRADRLYGGPGNDSLQGIGENDTLHGAAGTDTLDGGAGDDTLDGADGADRLLGDAGSDILSGGSGDDRLYASAFVDPGAVVARLAGSGARGDWLVAGLGDDQVLGDVGDDVLFGGGDQDSIWGGAGDDVINGDDNYVPTSFAWTVTPNGTFDRTWSPVTITDSAVDTGAADYLFGGAGQDWITGLMGNDLLFGDAGADTLVGGDADDQLFGGADNDTLTGDYGAYAYAGSGIPVVQGNDSLDGGSGNDWLQGEAGGDALQGGDGSDTLYGDAAYLAGADHGDDDLRGGAGDDSLYGQGGSDVLEGGDGLDLLVGDARESELAASFHGHDTLYGGAGADSVAGCGGDDELHGGGDDDQLQGDAAPVDLSDAAHANDTLYGDEGNDTLWGQGGADQLDGGNGDDYLDGDEAGVASAYHGNDVLEGEDGNDRMYGRGGADTLRGGTGNDSLVSGDGNDVLDGGAGDDHLWGGAGNDFYVLNTGVDRIYDGEGSNSLRIDTRLERIEVVGTDALLVLSATDTVAMDLTDFATVNAIEIGGTTLGRTEFMRFFTAQDQIAPTITLDDAVTAGELTVRGSNDDLRISYSGSQSNWVDLTALLGRGVNATLEPDAVTGQSTLVLTDWYAITANGADAGSYVADLGNAGLSFDLVGASTQNRSFIGDNYPNLLQGTASADTLDGSGGDDAVTGGDGNDAYVFAIGSGHDVVQDTGGSTDAVRFAAGISAGDLSVTESGYGLEVRIGAAANGDALTIAEWSAGGARSIDRFDFDDGTSLDRAQIDALNTGNHSPRIAGGIDAQTARATFAFSYTVPGAVISDADAGDVLAYHAYQAGGTVLPAWLSFDSATRTFSGTPSSADVGDLSILLIAVDGGGLSNTLSFDLRVTPSNVITGTSGADQLWAPNNSGFELWGLAGNDTLYGRYGNDLLAGGTGDDYLVGDRGNDTYLYDSGDGNDVITTQDSGANKVDTLRFGPGIHLADVEFTANYSGDLIIRHRDAAGTIIATDSIRVPYFFGSGTTYATSGLNRIDLFEFTADQQTLSSAQVIALVQPTAGDDWLAGGTGADSIAALGGADHVYGMAGDDTLSGGAGSDFLEGGAGSDTYVVNLGDGDDTISSARDSLPGSIDVLQFGPGIQPGDITVDPHTATDTHLYLHLASGSQQSTITVYGGLYNYGAEILDQIRFADGTVWQRADIEARSLMGTSASEVLCGFAGGDSLYGNDGNDILYGQSGDDRLNGGNGSDTLNGDGGNDSLTGDAGNDVLLGGAGDDAYHFGHAQGFDEVTDASGTNSLVLDAGITTAQVALYRSSGTAILGAAGSTTIDDLVLVLVIGGGGEQIRMVDYFSGATPRPLDRIQFGDGTVWYTAQIDASTTNLGGAPNTFTGGTGHGGVVNDSYVVDHPNDQITEQYGGGIDSVSASVSYTLPANVENLTLTGPFHANGTGNAEANSITGNAFDNVLNDGGGGYYDTLSGGGGNDTLYARGDDQLYGGSGDDIYYIGEGDDGRVTPWEQVHESAGEGTDTVYALAWQYDLPDNVEALVFRTVPGSWTGGLSQWVIHGNAANNAIDASKINITPTRDFLIDGGAGADTVIAVTGGTNRIVIDNAGDSVSGTDADDTIVASVAYTLPGTTGGLELSGTAPIAGTGNSGNNTLNGSTNTAANVLDGGAGDDLYILGANDTIVENSAGGVDSVRFAELAAGPANVYALSNYANVEHAELLDTAGASGVTGTAEANRLRGNSSANVLDGGAGDDTLTGGAGDDTYTLDSANDTIVESANAGIDTVRTGFSYTLGADLENLTLIGSAAADATGNARDNVLTGNSAANVLAGGAGNDTYVIGSEDTVIEAAGAGIDTLLASFSCTLAAELENLTLTGSAAIDGTGSATNNILVGNGAANVLAGGLGDDTYVVGAGDTVIENANEGIDIVQSAVSFTLGANIEKSLLTGGAAINATGNGLDNSLTGNGAANTLSGMGGADTLDGGAGNDTLIGGAGNDTYLVDATGDLITENANEGTDTAQSAVSCTLGNNLENLVLLGAAAINGTGNTLDNLLSGNAGANSLSGGNGNDTLDGGAGADTLAGGAGNDAYYLDAAADTVTEASAAGTDLVYAALSLTLGANLENLTLLGSAALSATGNTLSNRLIGNTANNTLDGGSGADTLQGGAGDDVYVVDNAADSIEENAGEGIDLVQSGIAVVLAGNVENLTLTGNSGVAGTGNALDNALTGNSGANSLAGGAGNDTLNGGSGKDSLAGGLGNDSYVVDNTGDVVTEAANEGMDTVKSSITCTLGVAVENLILSGSGALRGTGNTLANLLRGNISDNVLAGGGGTDLLEGGDGNDTLSNNAGNSLFNGGAGVDALSGSGAAELFIGGQGNDALTTGTGTDVVVFNKGDGQDTVAVSMSRDNTVSVGGAAVYADLLFAKNGNDLILDVGATDQITFTNYYASSSNRSIDKLQIVLEGSSDYDAGSADPMYNKKIETFAFDGLVSAFDAARIADPSLTSWALTSALAAQYLGGSDTAAIGGDLAYRYGLSGTLSAISCAPAVGILAAGGFGSGTQALQALESLQDSSARLS